MSSGHEDLIPPTPTEDDYVRQVNHAEPLPLLPEADPFELFETWLKAADDAEPNDPNAMALATVDDEGLPDVRMVLLKDFDEHGFVFYTNTLSAKGRQLATDPKAALLFHWKSLRRQVRIRGDVEPVTEAEADAYFATRARHSQIGAWASEQSQPLPDRLALEKRVAEFGLKFGIGKVPRPPHWSGYRVKPLSIEFWRDRPFRLHERLVFQRVGTNWKTSRLFP
ncbi:MAG: pyridoxamine 5'-phosphate oxidase [Ignavibacteriales bacterium]